MASIGIVKACLGLQEIEQGARLLLSIREMAGRASLFLYADQKFACEKPVIVRNMDALRPDLHLLWNTAVAIQGIGAGDTAVGAAERRDLYYRRAFLAVCIEHAALEVKRDFLLIVPGEAPALDLEAEVASLSASGEQCRRYGGGKPDSAGSVCLLNCTLDSTRAAIFQVAELYRSGTALSLGRHDFDTVLDRALEWSAKLDASALAAMPRLVVPAPAAR